MDLLIFNIGVELHKSNSFEFIINYLDIIILIFATYINLKYKKRFY